MKICRFVIDTSVFPFHPFERTCAISIEFIYPSFFLKFIRFKVWDMFIDQSPFIRSQFRNYFLLLIGIITGSFLT